MTTAVIRGGGDLATGVAWRLHHAGHQVIVCELADPLTVRRTVALSSAVREGEASVEGLVGRLSSLAEVESTLGRGDVAVLVSPTLPALTSLSFDVVIDARLAKRNIDTTIDDAPLVLGLGPGFSAGIDCHAVVETLRGHRLGRVAWRGSATADTGVPGEVGGHSNDRVLRAPVDGNVSWRVRIGDVVRGGDELGSVDGRIITAPFGGVVRGLVYPGRHVSVGLKIGDVDPRSDPSVCFEISDKALAVGGGVLEAVTTWLARRR